AVAVAAARPRRLHALERAIGDAADARAHVVRVGDAGVGGSLAGGRRIAKFAGLHHRVPAHRAAVAVVVGVAGVGAAAVAVDARGDRAVVDAAGVAGGGVAFEALEAATDLRAARRAIPVAELAGADHAVAAATGVRGIGRGVGRMLVGRVGADDGVGGRVG